MSALAIADDTDKAINRVNGALRGPVTELFQDLIPQLRACTRKEAYERIMNNPRLAATCFREFRERPDLFRTLMIGPELQPVTSDDQPLSCGRTLAEVITLIVRAIAKRYFRSRLGLLRSRALLRPKRSSPVDIILAWFRPPPPPPKALRRDVTRADALYHALRDSLRYEWQVALIPHYAHLPISLVREMGPRILQYRKIDQIQALANSGKLPPADPAPTEVAASPAPSVPASPVATTPPPRRSSGTTASRSEMMWTISQSLRLPALFDCDERQMRQTIAIANGVGLPALAALTSAGLRPSATTVAACTIVRRIGTTRLMTLLGPSPSPAFLQRLVQLMRERNVKSLSSPIAIKEAVEDILVQMKPMIDAV